MTSDSSRTPSGGYDVFISYRKADQGAARTLLRLAASFGQRVFLDDDRIELGGDWQADIQSAAQSATTLFVVWSRNALMSDYVKLELKMVREGCRIVPVLLDRAPLPPELQAHQGLPGLRLHERIIARANELMTESKPPLPHGEAVKQILRELKEDGVDLTTEQRDAVVVVLRSFGSGGLLAAIAYWLLQLFARPERVLAVLAGIGLIGFSSGYALARTVDVVVPPTPEPTCQPIEASLAKCATDLDDARTRIAHAPECTPGVDAKLKQCKKDLDASRHGQDTELDACRSELKAAQAEDPANRIRDLQGALRTCESGAGKLRLALAVCQRSSANRALVGPAVRSPQRSPDETNSVSP